MSLLFADHTKSSRIYTAPAVLPFKGFSKLSRMRVTNLFDPMLHPVISTAATSFYVLGATAVAAVTGTAVSAAEANWTINADTHVSLGPVIGVATLFVTLAWKASAEFTKMRLEIAHLRKEMKRPKPPEEDSDECPDIDT